MADEITAQVAMRRTFAIISHPDAGKTTLTEKLLLYGGAIRAAGSVKRSRGRRQTTSDWMEIERERGISISTSVLQFDYAGRRMNLLDTPGHNDFSEDTYRTLAAADAAVMLIDSVKGVEPQTIKLFEVCRLRGVPITTFINKMDCFGRPPLEVGALVTSLALITLPPIRHAGRALLIAVGLYGVATIVFGLSRSFPLSLAAYMLVGVADQVSVVMRSTTIQLSTPDALRGRVSAVTLLFIGASNQLGAAESGFVAAMTSATFAVVSGGIASLVVLAIVAMKLPELRRYRIDR